MACLPCWALQDFGIKLWPVFPSGPFSALPVGVCFLECNSNDNKAFSTAITVVTALNELAARIPPPTARPRSAQQTSFAHDYCVELSNAGINRFRDGFFPSISAFGTLSLLLYLQFPWTFLPSKRQVYHHLRDQMA